MERRSAVAARNKAVVRFDVNGRGALDYFDDFEGCSLRRGDAAEVGGSAADEKGACENNLLEGQEIGMQREEEEWNVA